MPYHFLCIYVHCLLAVAMAPETGIESFKIVKRSWNELYDQVKAWRQHLREALGKSSWGSFEFRTAKDEESGTMKTRLYGLGSLSPDRDHTLMYVDIPGEKDETENTLHWRALLEESEVTSDKYVLSKEEELLRERMRCTISGITSYNCHVRSGTLLFAAGLNLYVCKDQNWAKSLTAVPLGMPLDRGAALDPQMCPGDPNLVAFVCKNDIYLHYGSTSRRATFCDDGGKSGIFAGTPSFIIQEEFDRYSALWWDPSEDSGLNRHMLLYEETDESNVVELSITVPAARSSSVDHMKYPLAGSANAQSTLKLLEVEIKRNLDNAEIQVTECGLQESLKSLFPWFEYLVRAGWSPDGKGVWAQLMSRRQTRLALIYIPKEFFLAVDGSMQDLTNSSGKQITVLYDEINNIWTNYSDALCFIKSECINDKELTFLWWSEKSGYGHLHLVRSQLSMESGNSAEPYGPAILVETVLTQGEWPVMRKVKPVVDEQRQLVYFLAHKDSPLETHLYVTSYSRRSNAHGDVKRLTLEKHSHCSNRWERSLHVDLESGLFVDWMSSLEKEPTCLVHKLLFNSNQELPEAKPLWQLKLPERKFTSIDLPAMMEMDEKDASNESIESVENIYGHVHQPLTELSQNLEPEKTSENSLLSVEDIIPELISYTSSTSGLTHYAILFKPQGWQKGIQYPVILYVYGGPEVQLVKNVWSSWNGFQKFASLGYAVVMVDGRGSAGRGLIFEGMIKHKMGGIEVDDQVEGLQAVAEKTDGLIDMSRVAIFGWSYGGYVSLLALAQRPDVFKVAIAGGPVTSWHLYDTGYTERYMGLPQENFRAYKAGSVLTHVTDFPDEPGRLIILHGLIDENVHFQHTAKLIDALLRAGKPYQLQVFPKERHGVRGNEANEHMDVTILYHLQSYL